MTHDPSHGPGPDPSADRSATKAPPGANAAAPLDAREGDPWDGVAARLDALPDAEAQAARARCCGARRWVEAMLRARPFHDGARLDRAVDRADAPRLSDCVL